MAAGKGRPRGRPDPATIEMALGEPRIGAPEGPFRPVILPTDRGEIECRYYPAEGPRAGAIFVGGAGGGFDTPVRGWLYSRLCEELPPLGIAALRVRYRHPAVLEEPRRSTRSSAAWPRSRPRATAPPRHPNSRRAARSC